MTDTDTHALVRRAVAAAQHGRDLRHSKFRTAHPLAGLCYVVSEALYHSGLRELDWRPAQMRHEGVSHWFLFRSPGALIWVGDSEVLDATVSQFVSRPRYAEARARRFLVPSPSARARELMQRMEEVQ